MIVRFYCDDEAARLYSANCRFDDSGLRRINDSGCGIRYESDEIETELERGAAAC